MPYYEKKIISGDLIEIERYFATKTGNKMPRSVGLNESSKGQEDLNNKNAQKRLIRLLNANFSGKAGDLFVTLTYKDPVEEEAAKREVTNFIRRVRRHRNKKGLPEMKYIIITENQGRWHHHIIMNAMPMEDITELWGHGRTTISKVDQAYNFEDLGRYLIKGEKASKNTPDIENAKEKRKKHSRRWISSRNLTQPIIEIKEIKKGITKTPPKAPEGYYLLPDWRIGTDVQGNLYQSFKCVKLEEKPVNHKSKARRRKENVL
ncbi:MAG: hypothetical protein N2489_09235 [Clostridia bacterium]|nr:hypothetical protein [Clostridia bacterium]